MNGTVDLAVVTGLGRDTHDFSAVAAVDWRGEVTLGKCYPLTQETSFWNGTNNKSNREMLNDAAPHPSTSTRAANRIRVFHRGWCYEWVGLADAWAVHQIDRGVQ